MKNLFENWILKKAQCIQDAKQALIEMHVKKQEELEEFRMQTKAAIRNYINTEAEKLKIQECHIQEGDSAIFNIYSVGRNGKNSWDGGPRSYMHHVPKNEITEPIIVKITKVYVDYSYANELIDKYVDDLNFSDQLKHISATDWASNYEIWLEHRKIKDSKNLIGDRYGLYKTAKFDTELSFKPHWGLNVDSFLKKGTPEFEDTYNIWKQHLEITRRLTELKKEEKELIQREEKLEHIRISEQYTR